MTSKSLALYAKYRQMTIQQRYNGVIDYFSEVMPNPKSELDFESSWQLLLAVVLSAQCTDKRVNMVTPALFRRYPTPTHMADSTKEEIFDLIKSINFPNNKAENLLLTARKIVGNYGGKVPESIEQLESLRGVGRKSANVIASICFGADAIAVDTHVFRVANRIGLTENSKNPLQTEQVLSKYFPKKLLSTAHHWLILHGRYTCTARKPKCAECGIIQYCNYATTLGAEKEW